MAAATLRTKETQLTAESTFATTTILAGVKSTRTTHRTTYRLAWLSTLVLLILIVLWALSAGQFAIPFGDVLARLVGGGNITIPNADVVLFEIRLPRIIAAFVVGAALAAAGAAYQYLFRNPLVSPDILGVSSGAALGAVVGIFLGLPWLATQSLAFAGGLAAVAVIFALSHRLRAEDPILALVLMGVVVASLLGAGIALTKYLADPFNKLPAITYWLLGSFASVSARETIVASTIIAIAAVPLFLLRWRINLLALPDDEARTLGLDVRGTRAIVIVAATLMTAAAVAICGIIGWVGLVIPHAIRLLIGAEFSRLLPLSMLVGGTFMLLIDTIARTLAPTEIPPGVLTALLGAPAFIALMAVTFRRRT